MHSARHENDSARQALNVEALALTASFLSPLIGPFAFIPAILFGHTARWCWRRSNFDFRGGPTLLALIAGYSFGTSSLLAPLAVCAYSFSFGEPLSLVTIVAVYWVGGTTGVAISFFAYMVAVEARVVINMSVALTLVAFGLCLTSMWLVEARERARQMRAMEHLRRMGLGIHATMEMDPNGNGMSRKLSEETK